MRQPANQWHLRKELNISHLLTTLMIAVSAIVYVMQQETKLELLSQAIVTQEHRIAQVEARTESTITEVKASMIRVEAKIDRILLQDRAELSRR